MQHVGLSSMAEVLVRFLGIYRDLAGTSEARLALPPETTVADLPALLEARAPRLATFRGQYRLFVNSRQPAPDQPLADGDEVHVMGPITGGASSQVYR